MLVLSLLFSASGLTPPNITQVSLFVQESLVEVYPDPASTLIIPIENYADFEQIEVTFNIIVNAPKEYLHWLYFCGLESPVLSAVSARGNIGHQTENGQWAYYGDVEKFIITINAELDVKAVKLKPGKTLTVGQLTYGKHIASIPLLTISVFLEDHSDPDDTVRLQANASLKKLELEIASVTTDDIDLGYFNGLLWESRAYNAELDYQSSFDVSSSALKELRDAKKVSTGFWASLSKVIQNLWFLAVVPVVVFVVYAVVRRRSGRSVND